MKKKFIKIFSLILLLSLSLSPVIAKTPASRIPPEVETPTRPEPQLAPEEILKEFENGMPIEEFLMMNKGPIPHALMEYADLPVTVIVQLDQPSLINFIKDFDRVSDRSFQQNYVSQLEDAQDVLKKQIEAATDDVAFMGSYTKVLNGFMARVNYKDLNTIRELPGVLSVTRAPEHTIDLAASVPLIKADAVWTLGDTGYTGDGVTVAVIDTGIDYTHAMFDTFGDPAAYAMNNPNIIEPGTFPTTKVIGGYDFAGTAYDASEPALSIPVPDLDPLDENGHGSHVASTAAGVDAGFGSGVAPDAKLYALKVFGAAGSTNLVVDAIEWAMDPNGDGFIDDHVDVINMSLGSSFGPADITDPEYIAIEAANTAGIFVVCSAGNAGDWSYVSGSPGNTDSALAVAASTTGYETLPYLTYNNDAEKMPYTISYNPFTTTITADLVAVDSIDGAGTGQLCTTAGVGDLTGKIALIVRGTCGFSIKVNNAEALGAVAALIYNNAAGVINMNTSGSTLPAGSLLQSDGLLLKGLAPLNINIGPDSNVTTFVSSSPADSIASFSSRGPRGFDSMLKPEITAPGQSIFAAEIGSGNLGTSMSGTSMASPHVAGVVALMKDAHPNWSNEQIKAALMNTAVDLVDAASSQIPRQGAGRVDALAAVNTEVVAVGDPKLVSINWGVIEVTEDTYSSDKTVKLRNYSDAEVTLDVATMFTSPVSAGATLTPDVTEVTVPPYGNATVDLTLDLDVTQLPLGFGYNQMEEYYGYVTFEGDGTNLRLPFYFVPRPYTEVAEFDPPNKLTTFDAATGFGFIDLEQTGPNASSLWAFPVVKVSDDDPDVLNMADLRYVGMDYGGSSPNGEILVPGFAMWDDQHANQPYWSEVDMYIDADRDGVWDVVNFNYNIGAAGGGYPNNQWIVLQIDYSDGLLYQATPYLIYADYNSGFQEWYLPAGWSYISDRFDYEIVSFDWFGNSDNVGFGSFDLTKPPFGWAILDYFWSDWLFDPMNEAFSTVVMVDDFEGYIISKAKGIMLVDYHGKPGVGQAYYWPLEITYPKTYYYFPMMIN